MAVKHWSDNYEAVEGGAMALLHKGVKGGKVAPFVNRGQRCTGVR